MTTAAYVLASSGTYHHSSCSYAHSEAEPANAVEIVEASQTRTVRACGHCRPMVEGIAPTLKERQRQEWSNSPQARFRETFGRDLTKRELQIALLRVERSWPGTGQMVVAETDIPWVAE